jgi:hypothetical protein
MISLTGLPAKGTEVFEIAIETIIKLVLLACAFEITVLPSPTIQHPRSAKMSPMRVRQFTVVFCNTFLRRGKLWN